MDLLFGLGAVLLGLIVVAFTVGISIPLIGWLYELQLDRTWKKCKKTGFYKKPRFVPIADMNRAVREHVNLSDALTLERAREVAKRRRDTLKALQQADKGRFRKGEIDMSSFMRYKGYLGEVEFSEEDGVFCGKVSGIRSLVSFEGDNLEELRESFRDAVDDYLNLCEERKD